MKQKSQNYYRAVTILIPIVILLLFLARDFIIDLAGKLPSCLFYSTFHLYCPSCGNTRSVIALWHGDILKSLRYNVSPILFGILMLLAYLELAAYSFLRPIRLLPRKLSFYLILLSILLLYLIIRNFIPYLTP